MSRRLKVDIYFYGMSLKLLLVDSIGYSITLHSTSSDVFKTYYNNYLNNGRTDPISPYTSIGTEKVFLLVLVRINGGTGPFRGDITSTVEEVPRYPTSSTSLDVCRGYF